MMVTASMLLPSLCWLIKLSVGAWVLWPMPIWV